MATIDQLAAALRVAEATISATLAARGYKPGECSDGWTSEVRAEVAALVPIRAALASHDAQPVVTSARVAEYAWGATVHAKGNGWQQDTHGLDRNAPLADLRRHALEEQNRADQLARRARRMLAVVAYLENGQ